MDVSKSSIVEVIYTTFLEGVAFLRLRKALNITMSQAKNSTRGA